MAGTQQLPSWLTLSTTVLTNAQGQPTATLETTLELPLTYYGPSIPLGTDSIWVWGGLTPPPTTTTSMSSTATPITTTFITATPTTTFITTTSSSSYTPTTIMMTTSATPYPYSSASVLSKGAIIGIIFGAVAFFILLLLACICCVRFRAHRRNARQHQTPIWTHWEVVANRAPRRDEERQAGVGSPRDSGEEEDSFLRQSRSATDGTRQPGASVRAVPSLPPGAAPPQIVGSTGSGDSGHTSSSAVTDYGVLLPDGGPIGQAFRDESQFPSRASSDLTGFIMPPGELLKIDDEEEPPSPPRMYGAPRSSDPSRPEVYTPLLPPPPLDADRLSSRKPSSLVENEKSVRTVSYPTSDMSDTKVYTARRVKVPELAPRSAGEDETDTAAGPSSWRDSLGLGSLSRLRQSWFGGAPSRNTSSKSSSRVRTDEGDVNQTLLGPPRMRSRPHLGLTIEGERPMSSVSTKSAVSGNTVYHDAHSRFGTPVSVPSRALTPSSARGQGPPQDFAPPLPRDAPPAYNLNDPYDSLGSRGSFPFSQGVDVLDLPVPQPSSQFAASMSAPAATRRPDTPPGLGGPHVRTWRDSLSVITGSPNEAGITIDVLDAEPPVSGAGWRTMAAGGARPTTFGTPLPAPHHPAILSEHGSGSGPGSVRSFQSHLSPYSRSSGSAPLSHVLSGSNSSRPSAHSRGHTGSSNSVRSGSVSSFGRLQRPGGPISPSISAFGGATESGRISVLDELPEPVSAGPNRMSVLGPMPSFVHSVTSAPTIRSVGGTTTSEDTDVTRTVGTSEDTTTVGTVGEKTSGEGLTSMFRLGEFEFERVRIPF